MPRRVAGRDTAQATANVQHVATVDDVHELAQAMPFVTVWRGPKGNAVYQVGGKSFVFFRTPQRDASDPETGERWDDVIMLWVGSEADKLALIQDESSPFFTTPRFDGHPSVLIRGAHLDEISRRTNWPNSCRTRGCHGRRDDVRETWLRDHPPG